MNGLGGGGGEDVGGCGGFGWLPLAVVGTRWVMRGRWWVGGVEAAGMVMMAVGDGVRCGGVDGGCGVVLSGGGGRGFRPENSPKKFSGGGKRRWWPAAAGGRSGGRWPDNE
ncbi:hypothetical protein Tco_0039496 [Tanacetum coccineum]